MTRWRQRISAERLALLLAETRATARRAYVDRGHDAHQSRVFVSGQRRVVTPTIRCEIRRRAGIEPVIAHMKADGHLGRNVLAGAAGDAINLVLAAR
jgi:IS5 family transposase